MSVVHGSKRELRIAPPIGAKKSSIAPSSKNPEINRAVRREDTSKAVESGMAKFDVSYSAAAIEVGISRQSLRDLADPEQVSDNIQFADLYALPKEVWRHVIESTCNVICVDVVEDENIQTDINSTAQLIRSNGVSLSAYVEGFADGHLDSAERADIASKFRDQARLLLTLANRLEGK